MKEFKIILSVFIAVASFQQLHSQTVPGEVTPLDQGWQFYKGDTSGAEQPAFNTANWRTVDLPHDWSIEGPYDRSNITGRGGGYLPGGTGWYRHVLVLNERDATSRFYIEFDGIMANSEVWINGHSIEKRPNGYVSFRYDLTGHLNFDKNKPNVIAVKADNSVQPASRWYTGAGIYRHVRLIKTNPVHVAYSGVYITTQNVSDSKATVQVQTTVENNSASAQTATMETKIMYAGKVVATVQSSKQMAAGKQEAIIQKTELTKPALWSLENPNLYRALTTIFINKKPVDTTSNSFGIRNARFDAATGFWLNGKNIKIKGVCLHHDGGAVGAAVPLGVWKYRLQLLKGVGANAIRTSHNAVAPEFLDLCDQMGFLVMDETFDTWNSAKSNAERGYNRFFTDWWEQDTRDIVTRDRNHPSIIIYSIGNEIHDNLNDSTGFRKYLMQQNLIHSLDSTRPVTMALFRPNVSKVYDNGLADMMDVVGQNYRENELVAAHEANPARKVIGTENQHGLNNWLPFRDKPYMSGQFLWTGFDYLGENDWPKVVNGQGLFDRTGNPRNIAYQRKSWWSKEPMLYVMRKSDNAGAGEWISDWSPTDIDTYDQANIQVYSNCDEIELFLNDKSVGILPRPKDDASPRTINVNFQKGKLKAIGRNRGKQVAQQELITAGPPATFNFSVSKPELFSNWDDIVYVTAIITDEQGVPCLNADNKIRFSTRGPARIVAVDNGDISSHEPYQSTIRSAYKGQATAIVKATDRTGHIDITIEGDGLKSQTISLLSEQDFKDFKIKKSF